MLVAARHRSRRRTGPPGRQVFRSSGTSGWSRPPSSSAASR